MKHRHLSLISYLSSLIILLAACTEPESDYRLAVPAEAVAICEVNVDELAEQASLTLNPFKQSLTTVAGDMGGEGLREKVEALLADPTLMGIDFSEPAYLFIMPNERVGLVMKVDDENLLGDLLGYLENERICRPIEQEEGYRHTSIMDIVDVAYDGSTLLLTTSLSLTASRAQTANFITKRMEGEAAYFAEQSTDNEPLMLNLSTDEEGTFSLSADNVDGPALLAQLKRMPKVKMALRMAEAVVDAEAIVSAIDGRLALMLGESGGQIEAQLANTDFLNDIPDWAETAERYGCALTTLSPNHFEISAGDIHLLMSVEGNVLRLTIE